MLANKTRVLLVLSQDVLDRLRVFMTNPASTSYRGLELFSRYFRGLEVVARLRRALAAIPSDYGSARLALLIIALFFNAQILLDRAPQAPYLQAHQRGLLESKGDVGTSLPSRRGSIDRALLRLGAPPHRAEALKANRLRDIRLEFAYIPSPYRQETINFAASIGAGK